MKIGVALPPRMKSYSSARGAIAGASQHTKQSQAKADGLLFTGRKFLRGACSLSRCSLEFSDSLWLEIFCENDEVNWHVSHLPPSFTAIEWPCTFDWPTGDPTIHDPSVLFANRTGADFWQLWVNESGFLVYLRRQESLGFHALRRKEDGNPILYVGDEN